MKKGIKVILWIFGVPIGGLLIVFMFGGIGYLISELGDRSYKPSKQTTQVQTVSSFKDARPGETWIIQEDNIGLMDTSEVQTDRDSFRRHLVYLIKSGDRVKVIRTAGIYKKYVEVNGIHYGWMLGDSVSRARKVS
jgi:hypothetical protein